MKAYSYKDSGIEWLGEIPSHWKADRIKDVCELRGGGTPKSNTTEYWEDGDIIWITPTDFSKQKDNIYIGTSVKKITELGLQKSSANLLPVGTVIMSSRASIGVSKIASDIVTTNQGFVSFITQYRLNEKYLNYLINNDLGNYFLQIASGTTFMEISRKLVSLENIPLPPIKEQKSIVNFLDKATARIDHIISIKEAQRSSLKNALGIKINEIIKQDGAFKLKTTRHDFIGKIPEHYKIHKLKNITKQITDGAHFTPTYIDKVDESSIPFLRVTDIQVKTIDLQRTKYIPKSEHEELKKRCFPQKGDLLLSKNGTIGLTKTVDWEWEFSTFVSLCLIKPNTRFIDVEYLRYFFKSQIMDFQIKNGSKQITVTNLHLDKIRDFYIVTPPINEQYSIVESIKSMESKFNEVMKNLTAQIEVLKSYRKSLIHECVTGKKQVTDRIE